MNKPILSIKKIGKRYATWASNLARFASWLGVPLKPSSEFWAVREVSFSLNRGEALALIGQNGAGKSTLLKMITGTVRPSEGTISVDGRISAILELGLGFNPEFTGRQNIYHAGGLMGFSRGELSRLMPEVENFSELEEFFDQPLRVYSSGMQARLAFSLATAVRPDVLIVDEVLSVGDMYFQHKSFDRIRRFKAEGTAILLVTHSLQDARALCERSLLLNKGCVIKDGETDAVVEFYNALIAEKDEVRTQIVQSRVSGGWSQTRSGSLDVVVVNLELIDSTLGSLVSVASVGQNLILRAVVRANKNVPKLVFGVLIRDRQGRDIWGTNSWLTDDVVNDVREDECITFEVHFPCHLGPGSYAFSYCLSDSETHLSNNYEWSDNALIVEVINPDLYRFIGTTYLPAKFEIRRRA